MSDLYLDILYLALTGSTKFRDIVVGPLLVRLKDPDLNTVQKAEASKVLS